MKAFLTSLCIIAIIAAASDFLLGGPLFNSGGVLVDKSSAAVYSSPNVRLDSASE